MNQPSGLIKCAAIVILGFIFALIAASLIPLSISASHNVLQDLLKFWQSESWWTKLPLLIYAVGFFVRLIKALKLILNIRQGLNWRNLGWFCFEFTQLLISYLVGFPILLILLQLSFGDSLFVVSYLLQLGVAVWFLIFTFCRQ